MKIKSNPHLTILTIVLGLMILNYFIDSVYIEYIILLLVIFAVTSKKITFIIEKIWFKFAYVLSQIIPNILLSLIFYLLLTPLSFLSRLFKSKTNFKSVNNSNSIFVDKIKKFSKDSFERTW